MARMMYDDTPYRAVVVYDYQDPNTGVVEVMRNIYGPYANKGTAKTQGKAKALQARDWFKRGDNHHVVIEKCLGWDEVEVIYV